MSNNIILQMSNITKIFPGVKALDRVSFDLREGEIHALCGENGAGKSTLMKVLGGVHAIDEGEIFIDDKKVAINNPKDSINCGISIIYQEFNLAPTLSIAENFFLGKELTTGVLKNLDRCKMETKCEEVLKKLGAGYLKGKMIVGDLSVAEQQLVEIGKALLNDVKILVMDEPTAVLTEKESLILFDITRALRDQGVSIIYISHRLNEITGMCDRATILKDGVYVDTLCNTTKSLNKEKIVSLMVGREMEDFYPQKKNEIVDEDILRVENLSVAGMFKDVSFNLRKGEILGFSGLVGAGRSEVMKTIFGAYQSDEGKIFFEKDEVKIKSPGDAIDMGIFLVPEDRKREGLVLGLSSADNMSLPNMDQVSKRGIIKENLRNKLIDKYFNNMSIRPNNPWCPVGDFSGGNQQKVVLAKWMARNPKILVLDEPTRGIDVGAKAEIYALIEELTESGISVIMVSSEMQELIVMCDRIMVMFEGSLTGEFHREEFAEERIMRAASGI